MSAAKPAGLLRVVLDTNVFFSAFTSPRGVPFQLWQKAVRREYRLLISPAIIHELAYVLRMDLAWPEAAIIRQLKRLIRVAKLVEPKFTLAVVMADPDDNKILECAVAGNADLIVSGDRHLTRLTAFQGIGIVRPIDLLRTLGA